MIDILQLEICFLCPEEPLVGIVKTAKCDIIDC